MNGKTPKGTIRERVSGGAVLSSSEDSAEQGKRIAEQDLKELKALVDNAQRNIRKIMDDAQSENEDIPDSPLGTIWKDMEEELETLHKYSEREIQRIRQDMDNRGEEMEKFSITLFGRTMAGKSTFMEILKHGNGASIGKGGQRTTRDVRTYEWNGLKITDVPGIAAFGGEADERVAYEAAQKGDLIVFLLTDDHPQPEEADCLAKLRKLGKPVLGILNVKVSRKYSDALLEKKINEKFQSGELEQIIRQFYEFGHAHGQDWENIRFVPTHLWCAFQAQRETNEKKRELYNRLSRFSDVTEYISGCVETKGNIIRLKTFIDIASKPITDLYSRMEEYAERAGKNKDSLKENVDSFHARGREFIAELRNDIDRFNDTQRAGMDASLSKFVEKNYEQKKEIIERRFAELLRDQEIEPKIRYFVDTHQDKVNRLFRDSMKSFAKSYQFVGSGYNTLKNYEGGELWDINKWFNRLSAGSGIAIIFGGPWAWGASVVALLGSIFTDDIEEKRQRAKRALSDELKPKCKDYLREVSELLRDFLSGISNHIDLIQREANVLRKASKDVLAVNQETVIPKLHEISCSLNRQLVEAAMGTPLDSVAKVEREIGKSITIYTKGAGDVSEALRSKAENVLQEKVIIRRG